MYMRPVPEAPSFPVYGVDDQFQGLRWLTIWQSPRRLYLVDLGHGRPEDGRWISVQTVAKSPYIATTRDSGSGPTGLHDVATHAAIRLAELSSSDRTEVSRLMDTEYALLEYDPTLDRLNLLDGWEAAEVTIDGVGHECRVRRLDDAWAILVDLPDVAIVVTGPGSLPCLRCGS
jgi:hypothetical protein